MKITKTADRVSQLKSLKDVANRGCMVCPTCKTPIDIGIGIYKQGVTGLFRTKYMQIACYTCHACGTQWESDPYEIG